MEMKNLSLPECTRFNAAAEYEIQFLDHIILQSLGNMDNLDQKNGEWETAHQSTFWSPLWITVTFAESPNMKSIINLGAQWNTIT